MVTLPKEISQGAELFPDKGGEGPITLVKMSVVQGS